MEKKKSREHWEEFLRKAKEANPNLIIEEPSPVEVRSNKRDSFSENMKSQEQADLFFKILKMLEKEEKEQNKK